MKNKYNIGDTVFYIENRKVKEGIIETIKREKPFMEDGYSYSYEISHMIQDDLLPEKYLFPSKEELLASL